MKAWGVVGCTALVLIGSPLLGIWLAGEPLAPYLEVPPRPERKPAAEFSWPVFLFLLILVSSALAPFIYRLTHASRDAAAGRKGRRCFPLWGWAAVLLLMASWVLAWTRFSWFEPLQPHTFTPLWLGYIGVMNALTVRRSGDSLLTRDPARFALLFPLSALFWWFFEYLNRFAANWYYVGIRDFGPFEYTLFATLAFSTVLPAVASTADFLSTFSRLDQAFARWYRVHIPHRPFVALLVLTVTAGSLAALGIFRDLLYPLIWVSPLLVIVSLQALAGMPTIFDPLANGDWRRLVAYAGAALVCGLFWEMWNYGSLAHWEYAIPYVDRFRIFEMPLLGYAGYLPFGIECAAIATLVGASGSVPAGR